MQLRITGGGTTDRYLSPSREELVWIFKDGSGYRGIWLQVEGKKQVVVAAFSLKGVGLSNGEEKLRRRPFILDPSSRKGGSVLVVGIVDGRLPLFIPCCFICC